MRGENNLIKILAGILIIFRFNYWRS